MDKKLKFWIKSNSNDYIFLRDGLYFLVHRFDDVIEKGVRFPEVKTTVLTDDEFKKVSGFLPIKEKKLEMYKRKGRNGSRLGYDNHTMVDIESAKIRQKSEFREKRLGEILKENNY